MDDEDGYALADVLSILAGLIDPEMLKDDFTTAEIAREYNLEILNGQIDNIRLDDIRRNLIACTCNSLPGLHAVPHEHVVLELQRQRLLDQRTRHEGLPPQHGDHPDLLLAAARPGPRTAGADIAARTRTAMRHDARCAERRREVSM